VWGGCVFGGGEFRGDIVDGGEVDDVDWILRLVLNEYMPKVMFFFSFA
jgi:hypothetical protein